MTVNAVVDRLPPISLPELERAAGLMNRVDRKYFVPRDLLGALLDRLEGARALEIDGMRAFRYRSVYLDSPDFRFYRQHVQRRRHRFKVRSRAYLDSGGCQLEVKSKGLRGMTLKQRMPHDAAHPGDLGEADRGFIEEIADVDASELRPVLQTDYRRSTIVQDDHRITIDSELVFSGAGRRVTGPDDLLVETKSAGGASELDRMLVHCGIRPHSVSKYCLAASLLYPQLPGNDWSRIRRRYWGDALVVR